MSRFSFCGVALSLILTLPSSFAAGKGAPKGISNEFLQIYLKEVHPNLPLVDLSQVKDCTQPIPISLARLLTDLDPLKTLDGIYGKYLDESQLNELKKLHEERKGDPRAKAVILDSGATLHPLVTYNSLNFFESKRSDLSYHYDRSYDYGNKPHGTAVAGVVVSGEAEVDVIPIKLGNIDFKSDLEAAYQQGARVFNLSFGCYAIGMSQEAVGNLAQIHSFITEHPNATFVCAAGNDGINNDVFPLYPANFNLPNVISVASTQQEKGPYTLSSWSNYGSHSVHIAAPGDKVQIATPGGYTVGSGTSFAAPRVTRTIAAMLMINPFLKPTEIRSILLASLQPLSDPEEKTKIYSGGVLDSTKALELTFKTVLSHPSKH